MGIWANHVGDCHGFPVLLSLFSKGFLCPWEGATTGCDAVGMSQVTGGTLGAAVNFVFTARGLGHRATAPGAIQHHAAGGVIGALKLAVRTFHCPGAGTLHLKAGMTIWAAVEATRTAAMPITTCYRLWVGAAAGVPPRGEDAGEASGTMGIALAHDAILCIFCYRYGWL